MLDPTFLRAKFDSALGYDDYVGTGKPDHQTAWRGFHAEVALTEAQRTLIAGFTRELNVLVTSGTWCGDCVQQIPMLDHIARANPQLIRVRIVDRDEHADLAERVKLCGGLRVPIAIFMNEDFDLVGLFGDRTLARYRALAAKNLGASCPLPGSPVPPDEIAATLADWVDECERCQLICRLSTKLRERHSD